METAFFEIKDWEQKELGEIFKKDQLYFFQEPLSLENVKQIKDCQAVSVFIYSKLEKEILEKLPNLKLITTRSTGFDHIDLDFCRQKGISVCNVPFYGENTVAEHTFALILALSRNVHKSYVRGLRGDFTIEGLKGFDLKDKVLGVIGAGHIGLHVIRIAKGFGMRVLAFDTNQNKFLAEVLGFEYVPLDYLLANSDIISLHAPGGEATHHLINKQNIKQIKKGVILINTSRGSLVETDALLEAMDKGILAGAGFDVLEGEELIKEEKQLLYDKENPEKLKQLLKDHIILSKDNVVYTPHIAFYSQEALERILETTVKNINSFADNKLQNSVL
ncbi:MAG: hydroxyacid dehydrogenase [Candidatus Pacebacteria bacterium]|nr:hydroxyacid dehydrogenase [Candidatus Paceibacterota bacterium]